MALFNTHKDSGFLKGINKEIVQKIISMEVALFKISIEETQTSIYGETEKKVFYQPVRLYCVIRPGDKQSNTDMDIIEYTKTFKFSFIKQELEEKEIAVEEGDFIYYDNKYFEVDQVSDTNYWSGRNPNHLGLTNSSLYGYDYSIEAQAHQTNTPDFLPDRNSFELLDIKSTSKE